MVTERLEVRLDAERRRKLVELAAAQGLPVSEMVRRLIDEGYEEIRKRQRLAAVERMARMNIEDVPDPDELSRQLNATYDITNLD